MHNAVHKCWLIHGAKFLYYLVANLSPTPTPRHNNTLGVRILITFTGASLGALHSNYGFRFA
jgi:hypothetical protein